MTKRSKKKDPVYLRVRPSAKHPRWCKAWWPRDSQGRLRWVYIRDDPFGWTTIPDTGCLIDKREINDAKDDFLDGYGDDKKFQFRTQKP